MLPFPPLIFSPFLLFDFAFGLEEYMGKPKKIPFACEYWPMDWLCSGAWRGLLHPLSILSICPVFECCYFFMFPIYPMSVCGYFSIPICSFLNGSCHLELNCVMVFLLPWLLPLLLFCLFQCGLSWLMLAFCCFFFTPPYRVWIIPFPPALLCRWLLWSYVDMSVNKGEVAPRLSSLLNSWKGNERRWISEVIKSSNKISECSLDLNIPVLVHHRACICSVALLD